MNASTTTSALEICLLGRFEVRRQGAVIPDDAWPRRKTADLLKILATHCSQHLTQDELIDRLFPELDPAKARRNLQNRMSELRRVLEPDLQSAAASRFIRTEHQGYRFKGGTACWIDVEAFERALQTARSHETDGQWADAVEVLQTAVELYDGGYLPEDRYDDWAQEPRRRLHDQYVSALSRLATGLSRLGRPQEAVSWAEQAFDLEPRRESLCAQLMGLYRQTTQTMEALTVYETHREVLKTDLGIEPSAEIDALRARILDERSARADDPHREPALAVLPFADLNATDAHAYFADGLTEDVIARLGKLKGLRVMAPSAVWAYRARPAKPSDIARELGVTTVLKGTVRHDARHVRIVVALIDAASGAHRWTETYDRELSDVFAIQREIAEAIAGSLQAELSLADHQRLGQPPTSNVEAYHRYLRGRYLLNRRTETGFREARADFEAAVAIDPGYAAAHAGLAETYGLMAWFGYESEMSHFPKARDAALKALELDPHLADAHAILGQVAMNHDFRWDVALESFRRAVDLHPNGALAREWHAECLVALGRFEEAIAEMSRALQLDPRSLVLRASLGWMHYFARDPDEALAHCDRALDLDPDYPIAHWIRGLTHLSQGDHESAVAALERAQRALPTQAAIPAEIGYARARLGHEDEAKRILSQLADASASVDPIARAIIHLGWGDSSEALDWLEQAYERRTRHLAFLGVDPLFDELRAEPRFQALLARIGVDDVVER